jgi:hypothetical protein
MVQWSLFLSFLFSLLFDALQLPLWWWRRRLKEICIVRRDFIIHPYFSMYKTHTSTMMA